MLGRLLFALGALLALAMPAAAATPSGGSVSPQSAQTQWTGQVAGPSGVVHAAAGGTAGVCDPPGCDSFTLDVVTDGSAPLTIEAEATTPAQELSIEVVLPNGDSAFEGGVQGTQVQRTLRIPSAPAGRYAVNVSGGSLPGNGPNTMSYQATATLGAAGLECRLLRAFAYESGGTPLIDGPVNDPLYPVLHGHRQMRVAQAWARGGRGQGTTIAVLDTGVDLAHPDLRDRLVAGADFAEGEGADCAPGPRDGHGHGTHVSGLALASADNGIGMAGVAPEARLMPVRVCGTGSCSGDAVNAGIRWAADHGADVINLSLGTDEVDLLLGVAPLADLASGAEAVRYATDRGVIVVASAGNANWLFCGHPAADPGAVCVAAVDRDGLPASYSNLPFDRDGEVDGFRAFGGDGDRCDTQAMSTGWPGAGINACGAAYQAMSGTSMASPHVAGAAAVLRSFGLPAAEAIERLKATASNGGSYDPVMGYGIPDLDAATVGLTVPATPATPAAHPPARPRAAGRPACRRAQAALRRAIKRAVRLRSRGSRRAFRRAVRRRNAAQRMVRARCR